jgi:RNA polymerase sigma-70 factor (ECF subfamily)
MRYVEEMDAAEDIVQQAFTDAWEKNRSGTAILNLKAYLYQTVRNRSLTLIKQSPELTSIERLEETPDLPEDEAIALAERDSRLWSAIDALPAERRKVFLLCKRDGLKYREIAERLNISVKTVENQMGKALKTLRETAKHIYLIFLG